MSKLSVKILPDGEVRFCHPENYEQAGKLLFEIVPEYLNASYTSPRYDRSKYEWLEPNKERLVAIDKVSNLLQENPEYLLLHYYLGMLYQSTGDSQSAFEKWKEAYQLAEKLLPRQWEKEYKLPDTTPSNYSFFCDRKSTC